MFKETDKQLPKKTGLFVSILVILSAIKATLADEGRSITALHFQKSAY